MKNAKRPTRRQKEQIEFYRKNPDNWLVERDTTHEFVIVHRETGRKLSYRKGA